MSHKGTSNAAGGGKLKRLFYFALSSFVFPCILSIVQVSLIFNNPDFFLGGEPESVDGGESTDACFCVPAYIFITNLYVEIIGVLLATLWTVQSSSENSSTYGSTTPAQLSFRVAGVESAGVGVMSETTRDTALNGGSWGGASGSKIELDEISVEKERVRYNVHRV